MLKAHTAYFGASGKKDQPVLTVAGFVSDDNKWKMFESEWAEALASQSLTYFHMTDSVAKKPPFDEIALRPEKRDKFFRGLGEIAVRRTVHSFAAMIPMDQYNSANKAYQLDEWFGGPYAYAGLSCIIKLKKWAVRRKIELPQVFFEDGDEGKGRLHKSIRVLLGISPVFKTKRELRAFQASDLAAWEAARFVKMAHAPLKYEKLRDSFLRLDAHGKDWGAVMREDIISTCKNFGCPRR